MACSVHVTPLRIKITAEPPLLPTELSVGAPAIAVLPSLDNATEKPNWAPTEPIECVKAACCVQVAPLRVNTTALPEFDPLGSSSGTPQIAVLPSPDNATE